MVEELIPIVMFVMLGLAFMVGAYFRFRAKQEVQLTLRGLLSSSQEVSPEVLETLMEGLVPPPSADLRRGVISITLGIALVIFALILGEEDARRPLLAVSAFPFLVGIAYVVLWWTKKSATRQDA